jgi:hypothetical protein
MKIGKPRMISVPADSSQLHHMDNYGSYPVDVAFFWLGHLKSLRQCPVAVLGIAGQVLPIRFLK